MSIDCLGTNQYGMEIARLKIGQDLVRAANKLGGPFASPAALDDLQSLQQVIEHNLSRAEKDNSLIYLDVMPKIVPKISLAPMVKPHIPKEVDNPKDVLNKEDKPILLQSLPPYSLIQAVSIYEERRDQLVNRELIQKLNAIDKIYQTSLNGGGEHAELPNATQNAQLPNEVLMMMDEVMDLGGLQELRDKVKNIIELSSLNSGILKQVSLTIIYILMLLINLYRISMI
jgi:programmed cell death 6-interacting protein